MKGKDDMEKTFFGEETKAAKTKKKEKAKSVSPVKRKYTKRKVSKKATTKRGFVTVEVPAELAFQIGIMLGQNAAL